MVRFQSADRIITMGGKGSFMTSCLNLDNFLHLTENNFIIYNKPVLESLGGRLFRDAVRRNRCPACEPPNKNVSLSTQKTRTILKIWPINRFICAVRHKQLLLWVSGVRRSSSCLNVWSQKVKAVWKLAISTIAPQSTPNLESSCIQDGDGRPTIFL